MREHGASRHILVVEDDPDTRAVLRAVLEDEGYAVTEAADGQTALAVLRGCIRPLVVLLDQGVPGLAGTQVVEAVLSDGPKAGARAFLLLTGSPDRLPAPFNRQPMQQVVPVVAKPFDVDTLLEAVAAAARRLDGSGAKQACAAGSGRWADHSNELSATHPCPSASWWHSG
jgi:CheY-like chemotaxis protein